MKPERIINFIESYNFHQAKIKADTEKLKYYLVINDNTDDVDAPYKIDILNKKIKGDGKVGE